MEHEKRDFEEFHSNTLVVDSLFPTFLRPVGYSNEMKNRAKEQLEQNVDLDAILDEMSSLFEEELYRGDSVFWDWWDESGVDTIVTTVGDVEAVTPAQAYASAIMQIAGWNRRFDTFDNLIKVTSADCIREVHEKNRKGVILGLQNATSVTHDLSKLNILYNLGVRVMQITYNLRNSLGDGCTERTNAGLSEFGIKVIKKMNSLGILVDLSHCGEKTTKDAIEVSDSPVAFTHAFCRSVHDHDRGKTDSEIELLAKNDGYMGILILPDFITAGKPTLDVYIDHIEHAVGILGIDRVGIGTDYGTGAYTEEMQKLKRAQKKKEMEEIGISWDGWKPHHWHEEMPTMERYEDWRDFPNLTEALFERGFTETEARKILGENFVRVYQDSVG